MKEQLQTLKRRLWNAAGEAWIDSEDYYFANKGNPTFDEAKYREMTERQNLLTKAAERVENAIAVLKETGLDLAA